MVAGTHRIYSEESGLSTDSSLYLRCMQLGQMANFVYLIGCQKTRECWVVDPAWDIPAILEQVEKDEMKLTGALATHYHPDHVGGEVFGMEIPGLTHLLEQQAIPIHVNKIELDGVAKASGVSTTDLRGHEGGEEIELGSIRIKLLHTPGHTPGSQCFLVEGNLISGDTLFVQGCGRTDLPGGNVQDLYKSLNDVLKRLPDETRVLPGHQYGADSSTIGEEKAHNPYFQFNSMTEFLGAMGFSA